MAKDNIINYDGLEIDLDKLSENDMPNEMFKDIFAVLGAKSTVELLINFKGNIIQVPIDGFINLRKAIILKEYDGTAMSIKRLARTISISEAHIRNILKAYKINPPCEGQIAIDFASANSEIKNEKS